ncbi:hypothetical protein AEP_03708 [Curvibacter sp. AEP1-3]|uniref:Lcl C-terminal domain-containing protein n=1 Tax=Curvibacter sp. AEP1-3 TaxID=1844971 RepID=UPI000B3C6476|nr:DUF1566 domain-containing protein [Curvibacter sp. AEP1-3]ARV20626.1 hypothetical protein AEP_03708 [Curvibacter sp. AEP1-3]
MKTTIKQWLLAMTCALGACLPLSSQAEPYFTNREGNLIWDKATNLVWQRCSVGQTWDGKTCASEAKMFTLDEAQKQAGNGWRVPTIRELASLIYCSSGQTREKNDPKDGGPAIAKGCDDDYSSPTINTKAFLAVSDSDFWASSPYVGDSYFGWVVDFLNGRVDNRNRDIDKRVRLVRASQLSGSEAASAFSIKIPDAREGVIAEMKNLLARGPQALYMLAGQAQRGKNAEINGKTYSAAKLYELIIQYFPQSEFAVKASDQLTAVDRTERQTNAVRDAAAAQRDAAAAQRDADRNASNRSLCFSEVRRCEARCREWGGISENSCIRECQRSCD